MIKDNILRWVGLILVALGIFFNALWVMIAIGYDDEPGDPGIAAFGIGLCTIFFVFPGIIMFVWGWKLGKQESGEEKVVGLLRSYRHIKISELAVKIGESEEATEQLIVAAIGKGLVRGYIDRNERAFVSYEGGVPPRYQQAPRPPIQSVQPHQVVQSPYPVQPLHSQSSDLSPLPSPYPQPGRQISQAPQRPEPQQSQPSQRFQQPARPQARKVLVPTKQAEEIDRKPPSEMTNLTCPECHVSFDVEKKGGDLPIKCPNCGVEGTMDG